MVRATSPTGLAIGRALVAQCMEQPRRVAARSNGRCSFSARVTDAGTIVAWGNVNPVQYQHTSSHRAASVPRTYIRSADPVASIDALVTRAMQAEHAERPLLQAREALYLLAERKVFAALEALCAKHPDRTPDYDSMTQADVDFWSPLIAALPDA